MSTGRVSHTATLLRNGKVLGGGFIPSPGDYLASAELYDPASGTWSATGSMSTGRFEHTATLLPNGQVLVAGGGSSSGYPYLASAELYDPASGIWSATVSLSTARYEYTATLPPNGQVLVASGFTSSEWYYAECAALRPSQRYLQCDRDDEHCPLFPHRNLATRRPSTGGGRRRRG